MEQFGTMVGLDKKDAFEGWFCKIDDRANDVMISIIWGYSTHQESKHAFIQFTNSLEHKTSYIRYPIEEIKFHEDPFQVEIGKNWLSKEGIILNFEADGVPVKAGFRFGEFSPIDTSFLKPNIMGWLTYLPNECNHSVTSMNHRVDGAIQIGDRKWKVADADGYIEKDWGTSFPKEYVWTQANDWKDSSVVFSYATVPMLGRYAKGFFLVIHHEGIEYRFSSIEGSRITSFEAGEHSFAAVVKKGALEVTLKAAQTNPVALASPQGGAMSSVIKESLDGRLHLSVTKKKQPLFDLSSSRASIDVHFKSDK